MLDEYEKDVKNHVMSFLNDLETEKELERIKEEQV